MNRPKATRVALVLPLVIAGAALGGGRPGGAAPAPPISLSALGTYTTGILGDGAQEIPAFDPSTNRLFVVNAAAGAIDVLDVDVPAAPTLLDAIPAPGVNSVAVHGGLLAAARQADPATAPGTVDFFDTTTLQEVASVPVGALPDMVTFTPDGRQVVVANEGEPDGYCDGGVDPEGSVSIIDLGPGSTPAPQPQVTTAGFGRFESRRDALVTAGVRIFGPGASVAQDLEPEYITVDPTSRLAYVTLQENNALAVVDIGRSRVTAILPLGLKDHSLAANALDPSDEDGIDIGPAPVRGIYQPDGIDSYTSAGEMLLVLANEGDVRDYDCFSEEERVADVELDPAAYPDAAELQDDDVLGRLKITTTSPVNAAGQITDLRSFGGRSFSIRRTDGTLVFDSASAFEDITAAALPADFNSDNDENGSFDSRSDDKGPEAEGVELGRVGSRIYAFVGLERIGGVTVWDITDATAPSFVQYVNNRDFSGDAAAGTAGDLGPEGLLFIPAGQSPNGDPLLVVANEVSGTTTLYAIAGA